MNKKYAIFDMDGTLIDSMKYWKNLGREYLESKGINEDLTKVLERIRPMTMSESAAYFVERFDLPATPKKAEEEMNAIMEEHYHTDVPLIADMKEYVEMLHEKGVRMCVASATAEDLMESCLVRLGIAHYFEFLLSCEEVGVGKSQPDVYFEAARRLGALPEETAVFEDADYALETARKAGFYVIDVTKEGWKDENSIINRRQ